MELPPSTLERMSRPGDGFRLWEYQLIRPAFEEWRRLPERQVRTFVPCWSMLGRPVRCQRLTDQCGAVPTVCALDELVAPASRAGRLVGVHLQQPCGAEALRRLARS